MDNFQKDLEKGNKVEEIAIKMREKFHPGLRRVLGKKKEYDLIADDGYTAEVKFDELSAKTGNVGIEYECFGKPSGIVTTTADEWFHFYKLYDKWVCSVIKVAELRAFLHNNRGFIKPRNGGDYNSSWMYIINNYDFADSFGFESISST